MDIVYVSRDGENPELRYSLRTLVNVDYDRVWIFGGAPVWTSDEIMYRRRRQGGSPYSSTRDHIAAACNTSEVSDPFVLWNDDFFAMRPVGEVPVYHRGSLEALLDSTAAMKTPWARGMRETAGFMDKRGLLAGAMSFDVHLPLVIHKDPMREALRLAKNVRADAIHIRTLYGAVAGLEGVEHPDPKMMRRSDPFPRGAWLSSGDDTFRPVVEPVLRYLFPDPSNYERE